MNLAIFIYGTCVFALVSMALGLLAWGIVAERRDRTRFERGRKVYGDPGAALEASAKPEVAAR
jgi:hypothetical protein